jgi:DNA-directed RNA polymerase subunit RPC12/RpoP
MARQGENFPMKLNTNKTLYKCDRCSKEFWWSCSTVPAEISFYQDKDQYVQWHLCPQCAGELHDVIAGNEKKDDDSIRHIHNLEIEKRNLKKALDDMSNHQEELMQGLAEAGNRIGMLKKSNAALKDANILLTTNLAELQSKMGTIKACEGADRAFLDL